MSHIDLINKDKKVKLNLGIEDIDCPKEQLLDNRVGIPSRNYDYDGPTVLHQLEWLKCKHDELYFIEKILTLDHGEQPFKLWDYQKELIKSFEDNRFVLSVQK